MQKKQLAIRGLCGKITKDMPAFFATPRRRHSQRKAGIRLKPAQMLLEDMHLAADAAVVVHNPSNMFYLTGGYTGEGVVYISRSNRTIITDFRYTEQAERQAPDFRCVMTEKSLGHDQWVARLAQEEGVSSFYYEDDYLTVKAYDALRSAVGEESSWMPLSQRPEKLREIKTAAEAECIRQACRITSEAFRKLLPEIHEGMTEKQLAIRLDFLQLELGAQCNSFDTICASGENGSLPHAIPGERKVRRGDMITFDFGCKVGGYCSDMTRTVALGEPSAQMRHVYDTVLEAQRLGREALAPGKNCCDIDKVVRDYIDSQGYAGRFGHGLGHAVGIDIHENPRLSMTCRDIVRPGHVLTVEPGVYLPGVGGVRIEDTWLVTETGNEPLTTAPKELIIL